MKLLILNISKLFLNMFNASNFEYLSEPKEKQLIYLLNRRIKVIRTHQEGENEGNDPQLDYIVHVINRNISNYHILLITKFLTRQEKMPSQIQ